MQNKAQHNLVISTKKDADFFSIEKAIPMPIDRKQHSYPFNKLGVGDSFFVPGKSSGDISRSIAYASQKTGSKFSSRKWTEKGVMGVRIWRVG